MNIAYLCNSFPEPSEWYVAEEIEELRRQSANVIAYSVLRSASPEAFAAAPATICLLPVSISRCVATSWLLIRHFALIQDLVLRVLTGHEPFSRKVRTLVHTWLGAYFAAELKSFHPDHIHVHHGYFAAWVGMAAARFLGTGFSMTLHGSDLLVRADYLDTKLQNCSFCVTVSDFNRRYILNRYAVHPRKILVQHLGVDPEFWQRRSQRQPSPVFRLLSVGRLHPVKNHALLLQACRKLKSAGIAFRTTIAGEGDERRRLERLIAELDLEHEVSLAGQVPHFELRSLYAAADVVVLTSLSEGIPLTLMEAMAMECIVLAPSITGIPELVGAGTTGFLYQPLSIEDLLTKLQLIDGAGHLLNNIRNAARQRVLRNFNSRTNLARFAGSLMSRLGAAQMGSRPIQKRTHESPVLQQI